MSQVTRSGWIGIGAALVAAGCSTQDADAVAGHDHGAMGHDLTAMSMDVDHLVAELGQATRTAIVTNGSYTAASTWSGGAVPGPNDVVLIPPGRSVRIDSTTAVAKSLIVRGALRFARRSNETLRVETIVIADGGELIVGDDAGGVPDTITATIAIRDDLPVTLDSQRLARGLIAAPMAVIRMVSAVPRAPFVTLNNSVGPATTGTIATTAAVPATWRADDEIVIPATEFTREWMPDMPAGTSSPTIRASRLKNELRRIAAIARAGAPGITLNANLAFQHLRADPTNDKIRVHAANLTRNIIVMSEHTSGDPARSGHTIFMGNDVKLVGVRFDRLGRTNKRAVLSDPGLPTSVFNAPGVNGAPPGNRFSNPRGRYAVHFHKAGPDDPAHTALVESCAVIGTPGWGFVNHSSQVDFVGNVAFDFRGAGFVAEDGNETGSFVGNIAIGGTGNGEFSNRRAVFGNAPRMDQGDMGFTGEGFWFQSPDVEVRNNIAAGCKGSGFFFWTAGRFDPTSGHYTGRPLGRALPAGATPRQWDYDGDGRPDANVIADMPVKRFSGNIAYATFTGLRFRFVNHSNTAILGIRRANLSSELLSPQPARARFAVTTSTFWNNLNGIHGTYLNNADLSDITIVAARPAITAPLADNAQAVDYSDEAGRGAIGIDFHFNNAGNTLTRVTVQNYATGLWVHAANQDPAQTNVDPSRTTFRGCTEDLSTDEAGGAKGHAFFLLEDRTDNVPDNPQ